MKAKLAILIALIAALMVVGCSDDDDDVVARYDPDPQPPQGVYTVTGDGEVEVYWTAPYEGDLEEFVIWRSYDEYTDYREIGRVDAVDNADLDLIYYAPGYVDDSVSNGVTYFYAVSSVDRAGQWSDLSAETAFDTPRPEGTVTLIDSASSLALSGFDFSTQSQASPFAGGDVFLDRDGNGVFYLNESGSNVEIQSMGYTYDFSDIGWAPPDGWTANPWVEVVLWHTYVVRIAVAQDVYHYAKMQAIGMNDYDGTVVFNWAYQTDPNNQELTPGAPEADDKSQSVASGN